MDIDTFWQLIDKARAASDGNIRKQAKLVFNELITLQPDQIIEYQSVMDDLMDNAFDAALWDAAYVIGCGCGDDGFMDFRAWLIGHGKDVYEKALIDPESLIDLVEINENAQVGRLLYVAQIAYEQKTGEEMPLRDLKRSPLRGTMFNEEDKNSRFPKLDAKFGDCDERDKIWFAEDIRLPDEYDF